MCTTPFKCMFALINIWLMIIGMIVTIYGALLTWGRSHLYKGLHEIIQNLATHISKGDQELAYRITRIILDVSGHFAIAIFAIGVAILVISCMGCIGACCNASFCIVIYLIPLTIIIMIHVILLCVYFIRKDLPKSFLLKLLNQSVYNYRSLQSKTVDSLLLGVMMPSLKCCGYSSGEDFKHSSNFQHTDVYDRIRYSKIEYPIPCCKLSKSLTVQLNGCPVTFTPYNSNIYKGCAKPLTDFITNHLDMIAYLSLIVLGTNVLTFILAIVSIKC